VTAAGQLLARYASYVVTERGLAQTTVTLNVRLVGAALGGGARAERSGRRHRRPVAPGDRKGQQGEAGSAGHRGRDGTV
jgi:hypothetical protein